ncbi:MAG: dihydrodipicolinate synthase family protein [Terrimesophilobacter sp.]
MRQNILELNGVAHIALTPFDSDEQVDFAGIAAIVETAVDAGCTGIVPLAIMGEAHKLLDSERDSVLRAYVDGAGDRLHVIAGVTYESTVVATARTVAASKAGATAVMLAPPRNSGVGLGLLEHYRQVALASDLPVVVQDEPVTTNVVMPGSFFGDLAQIDGVFAVKVEEAPSPPKVTAVLESAPDLLCFGGLGGVSIYEELNRGAVGIMTGFAFPEILAKICTLFRSGDRDGARGVFHQYLPIIRFEAQLGVGGVSIRKQLFFERGIVGTPTVRAPSKPVDTKTIEELNELIDVLDLRATIG